MRNIIFALLLCSMPAFAATPKAEQFQIRAEILRDGKVISSPTLTTQAAEEASVEIGSLNNETNLKMSLTANSFHSGKIPDGIDLNIAINCQNSGRNFVAHPHMVVVPKETALIELSGHKNEKLELRITAERL